jgi:TetR/AcrR family transcriptional regulator
MNKDLDSREKLLKFATPLFAAKGFAAVSIREIAEAAAVNSAMISYHFGGKAGLYAAVLERQFGQIIDVVEKMKADSAGPEDCLRKYAVGLSRLHDSSPYLARLLHAEVTNPTGCFKTVVVKNIRYIADFMMQMLRQGMDEGRFRSDLEPGFAALALAGMVNFFFIIAPVAHSVVLRENDRAEDYISQALSIYLDGLRRQ